MTGLFTFGQIRRIAFRKSDAYRSGPNGLISNPDLHLCSRFIKTPDVTDIPTTRSPLAQYFLSRAKSASGQRWGDPAVFERLADQADELVARNANPVELLRLSGIYVYGSQHWFLIKHHKGWTLQRKAFTGNKYDKYMRDTQGRIWHSVGEDTNWIDVLQARNDEEFIARWFDELSLLAQIPSPEAEGSTISRSVEIKPEDVPDDAVVIDMTDPLGTEALRMVGDAFDVDEDDIDNPTYEEHLRERAHQGENIEVWFALEDGRIITMTMDPNAMDIEMQYPLPPDADIEMVGAWYVRVRRFVAQQLAEHGLDYQEVLVARDGYVEILNDRFSDLYIGDEGVLLAEADDRIHEGRVALLREGTPPDTEAFSVLEGESIAELQTHLLRAYGLQVDDQGIAQRIYLDLVNRGDVGLAITQLFQTLGERPDLGVGFTNTSESGNSNATWIWLTNRRGERVEELAAETDLFVAAHNADIELERSFRLGIPFDPPTLS